MSDAALDKFKTKVRESEYVIRDGRRIEVETLEPTKPARRKRKPFVSRFAQVSSYWVAQLEKHNSAAMYRLAHRILLEEHKRRQVGGEIILSTAVTGLPRETRAWAIKRMVEAKMIEVSQHGNQAVRVVRLLNIHTDDGAASYG